MFGNKYFARVSYGFVGLLLLLFLMALIPSIGSMLSERKYEINILTGQQRYTHVVLGVEVDKEISDTVISNILSGVNKVAEPNSGWRTCSTFSLGSSVSPHYRYHSAMSQIRVFGDLIAFLDLSEMEQRDFALEILYSWVRHGDDDAVDQILQKLSDRMD